MTSKEDLLLIEESRLGFGRVLENFLESISIDSAISLEEISKNDTGPDLVMGLTHFSSFLASSTTVLPQTSSNRF